MSEFDFAGAKLPLRARELSLGRFFEGRSFSYAGRECFMFVIPTRLHSLLKNSAWGDF